jgi:hypothetical protein
VAAAGNNAADLDAAPQYPAACPQPNVLAVGASDADDARAGFSNCCNQPLSSPAWGGTPPQAPDETVNRG